MYRDRVDCDFALPGMNSTCGVRLGAVGSVMAHVLRARLTLVDLVYASPSSTAESVTEPGPPPTLEPVRIDDCGPEVKPPRVDVPAVDEDWYAG